MALVDGSSSTQGSRMLFVWQWRHALPSVVVHPLLLVPCVLGRLAVSVRRRVAPAAEHPEGGDERERGEAGQRGGVQRQRHRGLPAEPAEVGARLAPRHAPVAVPRQLQQLRRRRGRRHQQVRRRLHAARTHVSSLSYLLSCPDRCGFVLSMENCQ